MTPLVGAAPLREISEWLRSPAVVAGIQLGSLLTARILPLVVLSPIFGGQAVPARVRFSFAVLFGLALGFVSDQSPRAPAATTVIILLIVKELLVGAFLAMLVSMAFQSFAIFGALVDQARGQGAITIHDPHANHDETVFGVFSAQLATVVFLTIGGHRVLLSALSDSFRLMPVHEWVPTAFQGAPLAFALVSSAADMLSVGVRLAAPAMIVALVVDLAGGLIARVAQQIDVGSQSMTLKGMLVLGVTFLALGLVISTARSEPMRAIARVQHWIGG